jgi:hypothetical protein
MLRLELNVEIKPFGCPDAPQRCSMMQHELWRPMNLAGRYGGKLS